MALTDMHSGWMSRDAGMNPSCLFILGCNHELLVVTGLLLLDGSKAMFY